MDNKYKVINKIVARDERGVTITIKLKYSVVTNDIIIKSVLKHLKEKTGIVELIDQNGVKKTTHINDKTLYLCCMYARSRLEDDNKYCTMFTLFLWDTDLLGRIHCGPSGEYRCKGIAVESYNLSGDECKDLAKFYKEQYAVQLIEKTFKKYLERKKHIEIRNMFNHWLYKPGGIMFREAERNFNKLVYK